MILVYLIKKENHLTWLQKCLHECCINNINLNPAKCALCVSSRVLLGHTICHEGLLVNPRKVITIANMPTPTIVIKIKRFLGPIDFYKRYFKDFAIKATPMCKPFKKDEAFN
jgi:hypothetical protein